MESFANKSPGAPWSPEPARRYNAVNDLLRRFDALGAGAPNAPLALRGAATVTVVYTGGSALPAYSLLAISGAATVAASGGTITVNPTDPTNTLLVAPAAADSGARLYGVAQGPVAPGGTVAVTLAGITTLRVASGGVLSGGETLAPLSGGMAWLGGGRITALCSGVSATSGGWMVPALLGVGGPILAAVVTMPSSGGSVGTVAPVTVGASGAITITSGAEFPAVFPYLDGYN